MATQHCGATLSGTASPSTASRLTNSWNQFMPKPVRTKPVSGPQVRAYAAKAQEYADAATDELDAGRFIAATSLSIHAGINAADAVCEECGFA